MAQSMNGAWLALGVAGAVAAAGAVMGRSGSRDLLDKDMVEFLNRIEDFGDPEDGSVDVRMLIGVRMDQRTLDSLIERALEEELIERYDVGGGGVRIAISDNGFEHMIASRRSYSKYRQMTHDPVGERSDLLGRLVFDRKADLRRIRWARD